MTTTPLTTKSSPALVTVTFSMVSRLGATLELRGHEATTSIAVVFEARGASCFDMAGDEALNCAVVDGEAVTILVRREGAICACGVFEVDIETVETVGIVLVPRAVSNLIVDQNEFVPTEAYAQSRAADIEAAGDSALLEVR